MTHVSDEILSLYSADPEAVENRFEVELHLGQCDGCRSELVRYRDMDAVLRHPDTREAAEAFSSRRGLEAILARHNQVVTEEREAERRLERLLSSPLRFRNANLAERKECMTEGMVRVLCREANVRHEENPRFSYRLATTAHEIATKLAAHVTKDAKTAAMGLALRECANALRYLGQFAEALKVLDEAEKLFETSPGAAPFDVAVVQYIRATVFMKCDRPAEGIAAARQAAHVFEDHGDSRRQLAAVLLEAMCLAFLGDNTEAANACDRVILLSRAGNDTAMLVRGLHNGALALLNLGELDRAERYLVEALTLYDELDVPTEKARATWLVGSIAAARGALEDAERRLDASRAELARFGLTNDAALATLEWAEVRLALSQPGGVADACRKIVVIFENEGMLRKAKHALAVLNEALRAGQATPALVRHVRAYLAQLPSNPTLAFVAPQ